MGINVRDFIELEMQKAGISAPPTFLDLGNFLWAYVFWKASKVSHVTDKLVMGERTEIRTGRRVQFVWGCWVITSWSRKGPRLDKNRKRKVMGEVLLFLYKVSCSCSGQYWDRRSYGARISFVIIFYLCCVMNMLLWRKTRATSEDLRNAWCWRPLEFLWRRIVSVIINLSFCGF